MKNGYTDISKRKVYAFFLICSVFAMNLSLSCEELFKSLEDINHYAILEFIISNQNKDT
jgi:hypothetical protein